MDCFAVGVRFYHPSSIYGRTGKGLPLHSRNWVQLPIVHQFLSRSRLMVRTLIKGYPVKDTVSIFKFHVKEEIWVRIPAAGPSLFRYSVEEGRVALSR